MPIAGAIGLTWLFNTVYGPTFYPWLNAHYTPFEINCWWTLALTSGFYWAVGLVFMALDMVPFLHARVAQYKLQPRKITWSEYAQVCGIVARNQLCVNLPLTAASAYFMPRPTDLPLPGLGWTAVVYVVCLGFEEAGFYLVHRAVHSKRLYAKVHKMHHRFSAPVAFASTYCTVAEHLSSNLLPIVLGVGLINAHWSLTIMFFCSLELGTLATQWVSPARRRERGADRHSSDYNIPGLSDALQHDWHHCELRTRARCGAGMNRGADATRRRLVYRELWAHGRH